MESHGLRSSLKVETFLNHLLNLFKSVKICFDKPKSEFLSWMVA